MARHVLIGSTSDGTFVPSRGEHIMKHSTQSGLLGPMSSSRIHLALVAVAVSSTWAITAMADHGTKPRAKLAVAAPARTQGAVTPDAPARAATHIVVSTFDPAKAWVDLGCVGCHGDDGVYTDEIKGAIGKPVDQVARWIRNAPRINPGTDMPDFAPRIDETDSVLLAGWVQDLASQRK
jgi:mono/diheme cytochrome c family protein